MNSLLKHRLNQRYGRRNQLRILRSFSHNLAFTSSCSAGLLSRRSLCLRRLATRGLLLALLLSLRLTGGSGVETHPERITHLRSHRLVEQPVLYTSTQKTNSTQSIIQTHNISDFLTITQNTQTKKTDQRHDGN